MKSTQFSVRSLMFIAIALGAFTTQKSFAAKAPTCHFAVDPASLQLEWTAFKTTQKVGVKGSFAEVTLKGDLKSKSTWEKFLSHIQADIQIKDATSIKTGNPARDSTLFQNFFSEIKNKSEIKGSVKDVKGDDLQGSFALAIDMNGKTVSVPMTYTREEKEGGFMAHGALDVNDFNLAPALAKLNKACEAVHKGPDGVSKTWSTVELKLMAKVTKNCNS